MNHSNERLTESSKRRSPNLFTVLIYLTDHVLIIYFTNYSDQLIAGILTVPAKDVCGFDPCFEKACKLDLTARCVSDAECKPTFISKTERILDECVGKQLYLFLCSLSRSLVKLTEVQYFGANLVKLMQVKYLIADL